MRHALAKSLYASLFSAICAQINASLAGGADAAATGGGGMGPNLGYVDIFGFEVLTLTLTLPLPLTLPLTPIITLT